MVKTVLVTGSSRGLGKACIIEFAKKGYNVVINYLNSKKEALELKELVESTYKVKALVVKADVSSEEEVKEMINYIIKELGTIDILVNNAATSNDSIYEDKTATSFRRILDVNLIGTFNVVKYASKYLLNSEKPVIINVSSTNGIDTIYPESLDYDASKAGVISLTKNLAIQYAPKIRVNAVAPGWINTDMSKDLSIEFRNKETEKILLKRFAAPEEIAKVIIFLASEEASYINGTVIRVDGGTNVR